MKKLLLVGLIMQAGSAWAFKDCAECPEMVVIPAGSFMMGSPPDLNPDPSSKEKFDPFPVDNQKPQHRVDIQSFAIGKYEVTQEQWYAVMGNNPSSNKGRTLPVENVSWDDAKLFVQKLSQKTGKNYRLPSEAEWEYATRAGSITQYFWGDDVKQANDYAWYEGNSGGIKSVGLKKPNQFGLHDMIGNAWEWVQDCWNPSYIGAPTDGSWWQKGDCSSRVLRSGLGEDGDPLQLTSANRGSGSSSDRSEFYGFRVARTP